MTKWKTKEQTKEQTKAWRTFLQHFSAGMGGKGRIYYIGGTDVLPRPLTPKEEEHLISCMGTVGEKEAKSRLIEHNLRLVVYIAKKFENTGVGVEDFNRHDWSDQRYQYIQQDKKDQAGNICVTLHRKRNINVP